MVYIPCPVCGNRMDCTDILTDKKEFRIETYRCEDCNKEKNRRTEYDQNGFVIADYIEEDD